LSIVVQTVSICEHPPSGELETWAETARTSLANSNHREIVLRLVDEAEMIELNAEFRSKPGATNVLSFLAELPDAMIKNNGLENNIEQELNLPLGDIVICAPIVAMEAKAQNKRLPAHWCHMVTHGVLHLYGFDHVKKTDAMTMEALETKILAKLGFPDPYLAIKP